MFIDSPSNVLRIAADQHGVTDDGTHYLLRMRRDASAFFLAQRDAQPSEDNYAAVAAFMSEITGLVIDAVCAKQLLSLYPQTRINVAEFGGIAATDVRDGLSFVAAHFFLGCSWPTFGDSVDIDAFVGLLQRQAVLMGFARSKADR